MNPITELPPFTPRLEGFRTEEFHRQSLELLAFPVQQDENVLDMAPFTIQKPPVPEDPPLPLLPHIWYPRPAQEVRDRALGNLIPPQLATMYGKGRLIQAQHAMRPLLSGQGPVTILGAAGMGKSTMLAYIASHERTRQRYRRIWWIDSPDNLLQSLALVLNAPRVLSTKDMALISSLLDDDTLLVIDNLTPAAVEHYQHITSHLLMAVEIPDDQFPDDDTTPSADPEGVVTLRYLDKSDAFEVMANACGILDKAAIRGQMRAWMSHIARLLNGHPLALVVAGALFREDGFPMERLVDLFSTHIDVDNPDPYTAFNISLNAIPEDYVALLQAFTVLPENGTPLEILMELTRMRSELPTYRALSFLEKRGFIVRDQRLGDRYIIHPVIQQRLLSGQKIPAVYSERLTAWVITHARRYSEEPETIYRFQDTILHVMETARQERQKDLLHKLNMTLGAYFQEYLPDYVLENTPPPRLMGERAHAAQLVQDGIELAEAGDPVAARQHLAEGLTLSRKYGSDHEIAEALTALAGVENFEENYADAVRYLEEAARLVYDLKAHHSLHIIRLALATVYRHQGRLKDALGVLDNEPDTAAERARIYRDGKQWKLMLAELEKAHTLSPLARAENYIQAGQYAEALAAIAGEQDSRSAYMRAMIYHLQGSMEEAIRGYQLALKTVPRRDPRRVNMLLSIGIASAARDDFDIAQKAFMQALEDVHTLPEESDYALEGRCYALLGALRLIDQDPGKAVDLCQKAEKAYSRLDPAPHHAEIADMYRTLGRACWQTGRKKEALTAFEGEVDHAQSIIPRDELRIGMALHHLGQAHEAAGTTESAIASYRRALTHKNPDTEPVNYFMTPVVLYRLFVRQQRYKQAIEIAESAIKHLDNHPPADLQHLGYMLCVLARLQQEMDMSSQAEYNFGRWLSVLAGRSDAMRDQERPYLALLAMMLVIRSMLASQRADTALPIAEQALALAERHYPGTGIAWSVRRDLGSVQLAMEQWEDAIRTHASLLYEPVKENIITFAIAHEQTGTAYARTGQYETALDYLEQARTFQPVPHQQGIIIESIADVYLRMDEPLNAINHLRQALPLLDQQKAPADVARVYSHLAELLHEQHEFGEAIPFYEQALTLFRAMPDVAPLRTVQTYLKLATCHESQGQLPQAAIAYRNTLDMLEASRDEAPVERRQALENLAIIQVKSERYDDALHLYEQALEEAERHGTAVEQGKLITALADTTRRASKQEDALDYYARALELLSVDEAPRERAAALRGYGHMLSQVNNFDEARQAWNEALLITTDAPALEVALTHRSIARACHAQHIYDEAEKAYLDAIDYHQDGTEEIAETLRLYGTLLVENKRYDDAIPILQRALETEKNLSQQVTVRIVETLQLLASAQEAAGNLSTAITSHHEALVYMDKGRQPLKVATQLRNLGRLYTMLARWIDAHKALEESLDIEFKYKPRSDSRIARTLEMIAIAYRREGQLEKAADAYKRMASYASLSKSTAEDLKSTLDAIQKHKATLEVALESVRVMERTAGSDIKDLINLYALIARTQAELSRIDDSNKTIDKLLSRLENHADILTTVDERLEYRTLAHIFEGSQAGSEGNLVEARAHFQMAMHHATDDALRWVISRGLASVQEQG